MDRRAERAILTVDVVYRACGIVTAAGRPSANTTLTISSSDPVHFLLTLNPNVVGTASVSVPVTAGSAPLFPLTIQGQNYSVRLNGTAVTNFAFTVGSDPAHPDRGLPSTNAVPRYLGLQTHTGRVAFRRIQIKPL